MRRLIGFACLALFIGIVFAANYAVQRWGVVPVGFGLMAPAAVYFVGVAFTLRDGIHSLLGRWWVVGGIVVGAAASYFVSPAFALASGVAFLVSEFADFAVYTPLKERDWTLAVLVSNLVGLVIDSILFLWLAFHSFAFLSGQIVGKAWMTLAAIALLTAARATNARLVAA